MSMKLYIMRSWRDLCEEAEAEGTLENFKNWRRK
jgi:hypothetical protein